MISLAPFHPPPCLRTLPTLRDVPNDLPHVPFDILCPFSMTRTARAAMLSRCEIKFTTSLCFHRCAFHAYADSTYAKHLESGASLYGTIGAGAGGAQTPIGATGVMVMGPETPTSVIEVSEDSIDSIEKVEEWKVLANGQHKKRMVNGTPSPRENGELRTHSMYREHECIRQHMQRSAAING